MLFGYANNDVDENDNEEGQSDAAGGQSKRAKKRDQKYERKLNMNY